jgi:hypothetical protein
MPTYRDYHRKTSNNKQNPNKNICAKEAVQAFLGKELTEQKVRYLHNRSDCVRAVRKYYTVRSKGSKVKGKTIGAARTKLAEIASKEPYKVFGFLVFIDQHVLVLDGFGQTLIDTDARKRDRRKIEDCYIVYRDNNNKNFVTTWVPFS